ncbi:MAG: hemerythrin domain-containing protein [Gallionella sp.]
MTHKTEHDPWKLDWDDNLSVGVPEIDYEHQHFISLVNDLNEAIVWRMDIDQIRQCMKAVIEDAIAHFKHEEVMLSNWGYPDLAAHAKLHTQILVALEQINRRFSEGKLSEYDWIDAGLKVKHILVEHLLTDDMKYRDFKLSHHSKSI